MAVGGRGNKSNRRACLLPRGRTHTGVLEPLRHLHAEQARRERADVARDRPHPRRHHGRYLPYERGGTLDPRSHPRHRRPPEPRASLRLQPPRPGPRPHRLIEILQALRDVGYGESLAFELIPDLPNKLEELDPPSLDDVARQVLDRCTG